MKRLLSAAAAKFGLENKTEKAEQQSRYEVDRLSKWIEGIVSDYGRRSQIDAKNSCTFSIDVDSTKILDADMEDVRSTLVKLHDMCMEKDVALNVTGFSRLRSDFAAHACGFATKNSVIVTIDATKTYALPSHPDAASFDFSAVVRQSVSKPKQPQP